MRCQISLSDEMVEKVDMYAKKMGISRSALCSMFVGQGIMSYDKCMDMFSGDSPLTEKSLKEFTEKSLKEIVGKSLKEIMNEIK